MRLSLTHHSARARAKLSTSANAPKDRTPRRKSLLARFYDEYDAAVALGQTRPLRRCVGACANDAVLPSVVRRMRGRFEQGAPMNLRVWGVVAVVFLAAAPVRASIVFHSILSGDAERPGAVEGTGAGSATAMLTGDSGSYVLS